MRPKTKILPQRSYERSDPRIACTLNYKTNSLTITLRDQEDKAPTRFSKGRWQRCEIT
jgi:hypothetical protein